MCCPISWCIVFHNILLKLFVFLSIGCYVSSVICDFIWCPFFLSLFFFIWRFYFSALSTPNRLNNLKSRAISSFVPGGVSLLKLLLWDIILAEKLVSILCAQALRPLTACRVQSARFQSRPWGCELPPAYVLICEMGMEAVLFWENHQKGLAGSQAERSSRIAS